MAVGPEGACAAVPADPRACAAPAVAAGSPIVTPAASTAHATVRSARPRPPRSTTDARLDMARPTFLASIAGFSPVATDRRPGGTASQSYPSDRLATGWPSQQAPAGGPGRHGNVQAGSARRLGRAGSPQMPKIQRP